MKDVQLILSADNGHKLTINMNSNEKDITRADENQFVYSDAVYSFEIKGIEANCYVTNILINGKEEEFYCHNGRIFFVSNRYERNAVFEGYYGFALIEIAINYGEGERTRLYSDYLSILIKDNYNTNNVEEMIDYIFQHQSILFRKETNITSDISADFVSKDNSLETKFALAKEFARFFDKSIGFFSANSQSKIREREVVDHIEKMQKCTPSTLQYMATHPEFLKEVHNSNGIRIARKTVCPEKTLLSSNVKSLDIYENRVILGFLALMVNDLQRIRVEIEAFIEKIPSYDNVHFGYIHSSWIVLSKSKEKLEYRKETIDILIKKYIVLQNTYKRIMNNIEAERLKTIPRKTAIFSSIPQYNVIFQAISKWFGYSEYGYSEEKFVLDYVSISAVYELYVLCKLIEHINNKGVPLKQAYKRHYYISDSAFYKNTEMENTFVFENKDVKYTLYYQPIIYNYDRKKQTGIGLFRNMEYSIGDKKGYYYTPDYVIKIEREQNSYYYIADAKFKALNTVEQKDVSKTCFKYLTSISPITEEDVLKGLFIIYGKPKEGEKVKSIYTYQQDASKIDIRPKAFLVPMG